jgi:hypothetical protein
VPGARRKVSAGSFSTVLVNWRLRRQTWLIPIIPVTSEAQIGALQFEANPRKVSKTLSQKKKKKLHGGAPL